MKNKKRARWLLEMLKPAAPAFLGGFVAAFLGIAARTLFPQMIRKTVDEAVLGASHSNLIRYVLAAGGIALMQFLFSYLEGIGLTLGGERFVKKLRDTLFSHFQVLPDKWHMEHPTGDIIQRCTADVEVVRSFIAEQSTELIMTVALILSYSFIMLTMEWKMALAALVYIPFVLAYSIRFYNRVSERYLAADQAEGALSTIVQENLTGVRVVRAFGRERDELVKFRRQNEEYTNTWVHLGAILTRFWALGDTVSHLQLLSVLLLGIYLGTTGKLSIGTYIAFMSYTQQLSWPMRSLGRILSEMSKAGVSCDRIMEILAEEPEEEKASPLDTDLSGDIVFSHVTFGFEEKKIIDDLSFTVEEGTTLGILGKTGSGKSTIVQLIYRLYDPWEGAISIGGVDLRDMKRESLRKGISCVLQEPFLFSRSIKENISITNPDATMEEIQKAAADACLEDAIRHFPSGYSTVIGERGVTLSGGQRQRLAIARAFAAKVKIRIFDDALSAVDAKTDAEIRRHLGECPGTKIIIAHRAATLMMADKILVLDKGRIAEYGSPSFLMGKKGKFYQIAMMQEGKKGGKP